MTTRENEIITCKVKSGGQAIFDENNPFKDAIGYNPGTVTYMAIESSGNLTLYDLLGPLQIVTQASTKEELEEKLRQP